MYSSSGNFNFNLRLIVFSKRLLTFFLSFNFFIIDSDLMQFKIFQLVVFDFGRFDPLKSNC